MFYLVIRQFNPVKEGVCLLPGFEDENDLVVEVLRVVLLQEAGKTLLHLSEEVVWIRGDGVHEEPAPEVERRSLLSQTDLGSEVGRPLGQLERNHWSGDAVVSCSEESVISIIY